ncbi:hypothetical protein CsSME_00041431 [Camellia sinensis var. sinensis]
MLQRRFLSTATATTTTTTTNHRRRWPVKQVTKANFSEALDQIKNHLGDSDFVAVSLQKTGSPNTPPRGFRFFSSPSAPSPLELPRSSPTHTTFISFQGMS